MTRPPLLLLSSLLFTSTSLAQATVSETPVEEEVAAEPLPTPDVIPVPQSAPAAAVDEEEMAPPAPEGAQTIAPEESVSPPTPEAAPRLPGDGLRWSVGTAMVLQSVFPDTLFLGLASSGYSYSPYGYYYGLMSPLRLDLTAELRPLDWLAVALQLNGGLLGWESGGANQDAVLSTVGASLGTRIIANPGGPVEVSGLLWLFGMLGSSKAGENPMTQITFAGLRLGVGFERELVEGVWLGIQTSLFSIGALFLPEQPMPQLNSTLPLLLYRVELTPALGVRLSF